MGIGNVEIECAHRIAKEQRDGPSQKRTIIVKLLNYKEKEKVLREYKSCKLCDERLHLNEDFSEETMEIRKELFEQANKLRI